MKKGDLFFILFLLTQLSPTHAQKHTLGKDSLQLTFYTCSGMENYHSNSDCEIKGSIWVDSFSIKINLKVKDDVLKVDKPYEDGDHIEVIFAVPELKDSENVYISRDNDLYRYKSTNDLIRFKKEWKNPLVVIDDELKYRYNELGKNNFGNLKEMVSRFVDVENSNKFSITSIPYGKTQFSFYPGSSQVYTVNGDTFLVTANKSFANTNNTLNSDSLIIYNCLVDSNYYEMSISIHINNFDFISAKLATEIPFMINVIDVDSSTQHKTIFSSSFNANKETFSGFNKIYPSEIFMDRVLYSKILPSKFDISISPIFYNSPGGWINLEKEVIPLKYTSSVYCFNLINISMIGIRVGTIDHRIEKLDEDILHIYTVNNFNAPSSIMEYVVWNDSLVLKADKVVRAVKLNSNKFGYVFSTEKWFFDECRDAGWCGCCTYYDYYFVTEMNMKTGKSNSLKMCHADYVMGRDGVDFYKTVFIQYISEEKEDILEFKNFKNNIFTLKFSNKRVVQIKVDEEKWRLIFIKNW